jgi:GNAT superfamily N-acetyltransferase
MSAPLIRRAAISDAPELARLASLLGYPTAEAAITGRLKRLLDSPGDCLLVAEVGGGRLAGWVHGFLCQLLESDYRVEVGGLLVDEPFRRAGVGRRLIGAIEEWAQTRGAKELSVRCRVEREEAHRFYETLGFRATKTQTVFRKRLGNAG